MLDGLTFLKMFIGFALGLITGFVMTLLWYLPMYQAIPVNGGV